jgi:hypothetical protein
MKQNIKLGRSQTNYRFCIFVFQCIFSVFEKKLLLCYAFAFNFSTRSDFGATANKAFVNIAIALYYYARANDTILNNATFSNTSTLHYYARV